MKLLFPSIGYDRLRIETDGVGVTTLVCAQGCPLRCKYCLNPESSCNRGRPRYVFTPESLWKAVKVDALYFLATGGGITFGGGEPLLYAEFIRAFASLAEGWRLYCETSLAVNRRQVEIAAGVIDHFIVDVKDANDAIYTAYTGHSNAQTLANLEWLVHAVGSEKLTVRLPLIPHYNTDGDRDASEAMLRAMGITRFDRFDYQIRDKIPEKEGKT